MEILSTLALAVGAAWCSGINLYATVAVLGMMHRYTGFELPAGMEALASDWVMWPALGMYTIEFVADKIPAVDSVWDSVHTFLRVPAGAVLASMAIGDVPPDVQVLAIMIGGLGGGSLALGSHVTKATTRLAAHGTGTSPVVGPVVSVGEDALVVGTMALAAAHPILSLFLVALMMIAAYFILKTFWVLAKRVIRTMMRRKEPEPAALV